MAGYAFSGRIDAVAPRRARPVSSRPEVSGGVAVALDDDGSRASEDQTLEPILTERLEMIRERWSQLTFFLFDADSWRT